jgi:arginine decarboxylase
MFPLPKRVFLTRGVGVHRQQLAAFEYALRDADIEQQNLVTVSSTCRRNASSFRANSASQR